MTDEERDAIQARADAIQVAKAREGMTDERLRDLRDLFARGSLWHSEQAELLAEVERLRALLAALPAESGSDLERQP